MLSSRFDQSEIFFSIAIMSGRWTQPLVHLPETGATSLAAGMTTLDLLWHRDFIQEGSEAYNSFKTGNGEVRSHRLPAGAPMPCIIHRELFQDVPHPKMGYFTSTLGYPRLNLWDCYCTWCQVKHYFWLKHKSSFRQEPLADNTVGGRTFKNRRLWYLLLSV